MIAAHMSFGIVLAAVVATRIAWRFLPGHQAPAALAGWVEQASKAVHYLLYGLLATQIVLGFLLRWSGNQAMSFLGLEIRRLSVRFQRRRTISLATSIIGWDGRS